jgi:recombination protein RecA
MTDEIAIVGRAVETGIIARADGWLSYDGMRIGMGVENAATFLRNNPDIAGKITAAIWSPLWQARRGAP